jgi:hypothetical protein
MHVSLLPVERQRKKDERKMKETDVSTLLILLTLTVLLWCTRSGIRYCGSVAIAVDAAVAVAVNEDANMNVTTVTVAANFTNNNVNDAQTKAWSSMLTIQQEIEALVIQGDLSRARWTALQALLLQEQEECIKNNDDDDDDDDDDDESRKSLQQTLSKAYITAFEDAYQERGMEYLQDIKNHYLLIKQGHSIRNMAKKDDPNVCLRLPPSLQSTDTANGGIDWTSHGMDPNKLWDDHCTLLPRHDDNDDDEKHDHSTTTSSNILFGGLESSSSSSSSSITLPPPYRLPTEPLCCEFGPLASSWTYLRLPALHEPAIRLQIPYYYYDNNDDDDDNHHHQNQNHADANNIAMTSLSLDLEQDGYLRLFDVAGILWPSGYMLSLCMANLPQCLPTGTFHALVQRYNIISTTNTTTTTTTKTTTTTSLQLEQQQQQVVYPPPLAIELGTGIGAPSIVLAKTLQRLLVVEGVGYNPANAAQSPLVVATDHAPHALALTMANAHFNEDVSKAVATERMDHFDMSSVKSIKQKYFFGGKDDSATTAATTANGFGLVIGSSLQGLFQDTQNMDSPLWTVLDELLDDVSPDALAVLVHTRSEPLQEPSSDNNHGGSSDNSSSKFELVRRISGSHALLLLFGNMATRSGDDESDFEVCIFRRRRRNMVHDRNEGEL